METFRLRFVGIFRDPRTSRSHVTWAYPSGSRFEVHVGTARPRSRGKWFTARFFVACENSRFSSLFVVCYTAVFSVVTQRSSPQQRRLCSRLRSSPLRTFRQRRGGWRNGCSRRLGFLHPKTSQSHVWEDIQLFRTLFSAYFLRQFLT